MASPEIS